MSRFPQVAAGVLALGLFAARGAPQDPNAYASHVYFLQCDVGLKDPVGATGFRARGTRGIITCLHCVIDAKPGTITARCGSTGETIADLKLALVDVRRDLAILTAPGQADRDEGLSLLPKDQWERLSGEVHAVGYPARLDVKELHTPLRVRARAHQPLRELVDGKARLTLTKRLSPDPALEVLSLDGNLLPGHSGAPVLDSSNRVVAVGNGGLDQGRVGICWAVPVCDAEWRPANAADVAAALKRIRETPLLSVFRPVQQPGDLQTVLAQLYISNRGNVPKEADLLRHRFAPDKARFDQMLGVPRLEKLLGSTDFAELGGRFSRYYLLLPRGYTFRMETDRDDRVLVTLEPDPKALKTDDLYAEGRVVIYSWVEAGLYLKAVAKVRANAKPSDFGETSQGNVAKYCLTEIRRRVEEAGLAFDPAPRNGVPAPSNRWASHEMKAESTPTVRPIEVPSPHGHSTTRLHFASQRVLYANKTSGDCRLVHYHSNGGIARVFVNQMKLSDWKDFSEKKAMSNAFYKHVVIDLTFTTY